MTSLSRATEEQTKVLTSGRKKTPEKTDGGPEDATFKSAQFPPRLEGPSRIFPPLWLISGDAPPVWRCPPVNHNRHRDGPLKGRSVEFAFLASQRLLVFFQDQGACLEKRKKSSAVPSLEEALS